MRQRACQIEALDRPSRDVGVDVRGFVVVTSRSEIAVTRVRRHEPAGAASKPKRSQLIPAHKGLCRFGSNAGSQGTPKAKERTWQVEGSLVARGLLRHAPAVWKRSFGHTKPEWSARNGKRLLRLSRNATT